MPRQSEANIPTLRTIRLSGTEAEMGAQYAEFIRGTNRLDALTYHFRRLGMFVARSSMPRKIRMKSILSNVLLKVLDGWTWKMSQQRPDASRLRQQAALRTLGKSDRFGHAIFAMDALQNIVNLAKSLEGHYIPELSTLCAGAATSAAACSSAMCWDRASRDSSLLHARNFDFPAPGLWDNDQAVVFCTPRSGLRYGYVASYGADVPGVTAFNEAGISITLHTRFHSKFSFAGFGICDLSHELIRCASTIEEVIQIAKKYHAYSTWGIAVSSAQEKKAIVLEKAGRRQGVVRSTGDYLTSTNHYQTPDMRWGEVSPSPSFVDHSRARLEMLNAVIDNLQSKGGATVTDLQELLFCRKQAGSSPNGSNNIDIMAGSVLRQCYTVNSVVIDANKEQVHVAAGNISAQTPQWKTVDWSWDNAPGMSVIPLDDRRTNETPGYETFAEAYRLNLLELDSEPGLDLLLKAYSEAPTDPTLQFLSGAVLLGRGQISEAAERFEAVVLSPQRNFRYGQALFWSAQAEQALGNQGAAKARLRELSTLREPLLLQYQSTQHQNKIATKLAKKPENVVLDYLGVDILL